MHGSGSAWQSVHIVYYDSQDRLLVRIVGPVCAELARRGDIRQFFFIRYLDGGPHVRLRVMPAADRGGAPVLKALAELLRLEVRREPSLATDAELLDRHGGEVRASSRFGPLRPNNTVHCERYMPELDRYGGEAGLAIVEPLFCESSRIALHLLEDGEMSDAERLNSGLRLLVEGASTFIEDLSMARRFFGSYAASALGSIGLTMADQQRLQATFLQRCASSLPRMADVLQRAFSLAMTRRAASDWARPMQKAVTDLHAAGVGDSVGQPKVSMVASSCMHMMSNRMGLTPLQEAYLATALARAAAPEGWPAPGSVAGIVR